MPLALLAVVNLSLLAGYSSSYHYGERPLGAVARGVPAGPLSAARAFVDTQDKVESGAGYIVGADLDLRLQRGPLLGLGYRYRDGGNWIKRSWWVRSGLAAGPTTLVFAWDASTANRVRSLELCSQLRRGHFIVEPRVAVARYDAGAWGAYGSFLLGWQF